MCVIGIAVISGILEGLSSHRVGAKKEEKEKASEKEECPGLRPGNS